MKKFYGGLRIGLLRPVDHLYKVLAFALLAIGLTLLSTTSLCFVNQYAYADTQSNSSLSVSLNANQEKYEKDDIAEISLAILNNSQDAHLDVKRDMVLPDGLELIDAEELSKQHGNLDPQQSINELIRVKLVNSDSTSASGLANTGDNQFLLILLIVALVSFVAFMLTKRRAKNLMSAVLVVVIAMSGVSLPAIAMADEEVKDVQSSQAIDLNFDGTVYAVGVAISSKVKSPTSNPNNTNSSETTSRSQWIAELLKASNIEIQNDIEDCPYTDIAGNKYGNEIKTAWAQGVLDGIVDENVKQFLPGQPATKEFALATTVLALGFTNDGSEYKGVDSKDCSYPALTQIGLDLGFMSLDDSGYFYSKQNLSNADKQSLLKAIGAYLNQEPSSEETNIVYRDDVVVIPEYKLDGQEFIVDTNQYPIDKGSKIALLPIGGNMAGNSGIVDSLTILDNGLASISIVQATKPEEIFKSFVINDNAKYIDFSSIELADGVELEEEIAPLAIAESDKSDLTIKFKVPIDKNCDANIQFKPSIKFVAEWNIFENYKRFDVVFGNDLKVGVSGKLSKVDKYIKLTKKPITIYTDGPASVGVMLQLHFKADGTASLEASIKNTVDFGFKKDHFYSRSSTDAEISAKLEASAQGGVAPYIYAELAGIELIDFQLDAGIQGKANIIEHSSELVCNDLLAYPLLTLTCGKNTEWMKTLNISLEKKFITEKNCPKKYKFGWHLENGAIVPKCTWEESSGPDEPSTDPSAKDFKYVVGDYVLANSEISRDTPFKGMTGSPEDLGVIEHSVGGCQFAWFYNRKTASTLSGVDDKQSIHAYATAEEDYYDPGIDAGYGAYIYLCQNKLADAETIVIPDKINGVDVVCVSLEFVPGDNFVNPDPKIIDVRQAKHLKYLQVRSPEKILFASDSSISEIIIESGKNYKDALDITSLKNLSAITVGDAPNKWRIDNPALLSFAVDNCRGESFDLSNSKKLRRVLIGGDSITRQGVNLNGCDSLEYISIDNYLDESKGYEWGEDPEYK